MLVWSSEHNNSSKLQYMCDTADSFCFMQYSIQGSPAITDTPKRRLWKNCTV